MIASLVPAAAHADPLPCTEVAAIGERCPEWNAVYHGPSGSGYDVPWAISASPDGSTIYASGEAFNANTTKSDAVTRAFDAATGAERWTATFEGGDGSDIPIASASSPDGKTLFVGVISNYRIDQSTFSVVANFATLAYEASTGTLLWAREWSIPGSSTSIAWPSSIAVSPDGSQVFITGYSRSYAPEDLPQFTVVAYDAADGEELWTFRDYQGGANEILVSPDGNRVFILGSHQPFSSPTRFLVVALEAADPDRLGKVDWTATYLDEDGGWNYGWQLALSPDGSRIFATGQANLINGVGAHSTIDTVAYSAATGEQLWIASSAPASPMIAGANGLVVSPSGDRVFVTGYEFTGLPTNRANWVTLAYDAATGAQLWRTDFTQGSWNFAFGIAVSPDGSSVYVTGSNSPVTTPLTNPPVRFAATVAYNAATGAQRWTARHNRAPDFISAQGAAITATRDGVFVAASLSQGIPTVQGAPVAGDQGDWSVLRYQP